MSASREPIEIACSEKAYNTLLLLLTGGDFAQGQRWFTKSTQIPMHINSFAEGMETDYDPYEV